jgi:hypothetical protein
LFSKLSPTALVCQKSSFLQFCNRLSDLVLLPNLVPGNKPIDQQVSNLLAGAVPAQSIALYAGGMAVGRVFASPLAFLNDVVDFSRTFFVAGFSVALKNNRVPTEMAMPLCSIKYLGKLGVRQHHSFLWDNNILNSFLSITGNLDIVKFNKNNLQQIYLILLFKLS